MIDKNFVNFDLEKAKKIHAHPIWGESDRGCVLMIVSDLENSLEKLLRAWIGGASKISKKRLDDIFDHVGPLGTFSGKIGICEAFGLVSKNISLDLHRLRGIRNRAAHDGGEFSLSHPDIMHELEQIEDRFDALDELKRFSFSQMDEKGNESVVDIDEFEASGRGCIKRSKVLLQLKSFGLEVALNLRSIAAPSLAKKGIFEYEKACEDFRLDELSQERKKPK